MYGRTLIVAVALFVSGGLLRAGDPDDLGARLEESRAGLRVMRVVSKGLVDQFGLREGDLIVRVNRREVHTVQDFTRAVQEKEVVFEYIRNHITTTTRYRLYRPTEDAMKTPSPWEKQYVVSEATQRKPVVVRVPDRR